MKPFIFRRLTPAVVTLTLALVLGCSSHSSRALRSQARVQEAEARATALAQAPGGTVKESELEEEDGLLIWSFDIAVPGQAGVTEVQVDARTGRVARIEHETEAQEKAEQETEH